MTGHTGCKGDWLALCLQRFGAELTGYALESGRPVPGPSRLPQPGRDLSDQRHEHAAHLPEAARHTAGVRAVVVVTSDKCYVNREWVWIYREDEPLGG
ncbi:hypothetical protein [uncultured Thiodictyon sp.]|uniref:hypothetical protein n=1 Tax=uncultured Thiodictyon sp. TaxID=1846217 RepID=UPI0025E6800B|nr:hypothetical protein [uncultured Thiodictyon sp.]